MTLPFSGVILFFFIMDLKQSDLWFKECVEIKDGKFTYLSNLKESFHDFNGSGVDILDIDFKRGLEEIFKREGIQFVTKTKRKKMVWCPDY